MSKKQQGFELAGGLFRRLSERWGGKQYRIMDYIFFLRVILEGLPQLRSIDLYEDALCSVKAKRLSPVDETNYRNLVERAQQDVWRTFAPTMLDMVLFVMGKLQSSRKRKFELKYRSAPIGLRYTTPPFRYGLEYLTTLDLQRSDSKYVDKNSGQWKGMASFLASLQNLERLNVDIDLFVTSDQVFKKGASWPYLKVLSLRALRIRSESMLGFFIKNGSRLRELNMDHLVLIDQAAGENYQEHLSYPWLVFLKYIKEKCLHRLQRCSIHYMTSTMLEEEECILFAKGFIPPDRGAQYLKCGSNLNDLGKRDEVSECERIKWDKQTLEAIVRDTKLSDQRKNLEFAQRLAELEEKIVREDSYEPEVLLDAPKPYN